MEFTEEELEVLDLVLTEFMESNVDQVADENDFEIKSRVYHELAVVQDLMDRVAKAREKKGEKEEEGKERGRN